MYTTVFLIHIHRSWTFTLPLLCYITSYTFACKLYVHSHYPFTCVCTGKVRHEHLLLLQAHSHPSPHIQLQAPFNTLPTGIHTHIHTYVPTLSLLPQEVRRSDCPPMTVIARKVPDKSPFRGRGQAQKIIIIKVLSWWPLPCAKHCWEHSVCIILSDIHSNATK